MTREKQQQIVSEEHYAIRILKDGTWLYQGTPITRHNMVQLFARVLTRDEKGDYWLSTPYEKGRIEVEDAPFQAVELKVEGSGEGQILRFRTNVDDDVVAGKDRVLRVALAPKTATLSPYLYVRDGLEARLTRAVYYQLVDLAVEDKTDANWMGVWSGGAFFRIGKVS